jgi:hypothetical protein
MTVHSEAALRHGASKDEIAEALGVAVAVTAGAALVCSKRSKNFREGERDRARSTAAADKDVDARDIKPAHDGDNYDSNAIEK